MTNLDELAELQRKARKPAGHEAATGETWLVDHADKIFGPHSREELVSMRSSGMIDSTTKVWTEGWLTWKPVESVIPSAPAALPIDYATPTNSSKPVPARSRGMIARYRRRVGHRSFIFQIWLLAWTAFYLLWILSILVSSASHTTPAPIPRAPFPGFPVPTPQPNLADLLALFTSSWICFLAGWGAVGLPVGIAAVATLENNKSEN